MQTANITWYTT